jgi:hypothetical protein
MSKLSQARIDRYWSEVGFANCSLRSTQRLSQRVYKSRDITWTSVHFRVSRQPITVRAKACHGALNPIAKRKGSDSSRKAPAQSVTG